MASFFAEIAQNPAYYGLWIQSGAVFVSAILVIATILWNSRIAQRRATLDMLIGERQSGPYQRYRQAFVALQKEGHLVQYLAPDRLASDEAQTIQYVLNTYELAAIGVRRGIVHQALQAVVPDHNGRGLAVL